MMHHLWGVRQLLLAASVLQACVGTIQLSASATIKWSACPSTFPPGLECGSVDVPMTYKPGNSTAALNNDRVTLGFSRLRSTGRHSKDLLFINPGGPGVPASSYLSVGLVFPNIAFSDAVRDRFDIIGLDPRGTGLSSPVQCNPEIYNERVTTFVNNSQSYKALVDHNRRLGESCSKLTGPLLNHLDSIHVAKDYEVVRQAFAATKFNYFGLSYGSLIGSQYLSLFPEKVGRMGLDGLVDHSESEVSTLLSEATTYEASLNQWFDWCDKNSTCALYGKSSRKAFDTLLARAEAKPIPAPGCNGTCRSDVTAEEMRDQAQLYLYFYDLPTLPNWVTLGTALAEALNGNATLLSSQLATDQVSQTLLGSVYIYLSMQCQDWLHRAKDETDITERLKAVQPFAPRTKGSGQMFYIQSRCIGWPTAVSNGQAMLNNRTSRDPPILISNAVYDPTCSLVWANGLRQQLPSAVSITRNGPGHTSHSVFGETREAMQHYLATGELPKDGTIYET